jgi:hypothetical protein
MSENDEFTPGAIGSIVGKKQTSHDDFEPGESGTVSPPISTFSAPWFGDIATQTGRGLLSGVTNIAAIPAQISQLGDYASNALSKGRDVYYEMTHAAPKGSAEIAEIARNAQNQALKTQSEREGKTAKVFGYQYPTPSGMEELTQRALGLTSAPPQTTAGRYVHSAVEAVPLAVATMGESLFPRIAMGLGSGLIGEFGNELEEAGVPGAGFAGAIAGGAAGTRLAKGATNIVNPTLGAQRKFASAISKDVASGKSNMLTLLNPDGTPVIPNITVGEAFYGPSMAKTVGQAGNTSEATLNKLGAINKERAARLENINADLSNYIAQTTNLKNAAPDLEAAIKKENNTKISALYDLAENHPNAQAVDSSALRQAHSGPTIERIGNQVASRIGDPGYKVQPPKFDQNGNFIPGNLQYYDEVGKELRSQYTELAKNPANAAEVRRLELLRKNLLSAVDDIIPEYASARGAAFDSINQQGMVSNGASILKKADPKELFDAKKAYDKSLPQHQDMFNQGLAFDLQQQAEIKGPEGFLKYISHPNRENFIRHTLGDDIYESLNGKATADNLIKQIAPYQAWGAASDRTSDIVKGAVYSNILHGVATLNLPGLVHNITGLAGIHAKDLLSSIANRKKAQAILDLVASDDPSKMQMLYKMVKKDPNTQSIMQALVNRTKKIAYANSIVNAQQRPDQQSTGGAITRATGGRVGHEHLVTRLMRAAERAKKTANSVTEPLLQAPDEHIVKALHIANEAIQ